MSLKRRLVLPYSSPGNILWWATPPWGQVALSQASVAQGGNLVLWDTVFGLVIAGGAADPLGGNNAYSLTEDLLNGTHRVWNTSQINLVAGPAKISASIKPRGGRDVCFREENIAGVPEVIFNTATGAVLQTQPGVIITVINLGGGWLHFSVEYPTANFNGIGIEATIGLNRIYVGDGVSGLDVFDVVVEQTRVSGITDMVPPVFWPVGKTGLYNGAQPVAANQPFYRLNPTTGLYEYWNPLATTKEITNTTAELMGLLSGLNKPFSALVVFRAAVGAATNSMQPWRADRTFYDFIGNRNAASNPFSDRHDAIGAHIISGILPATTQMIADIWTFNGTNGTMFRNGVLVAGPGNQQSLENVVTLLRTIITEGGMVELAAWNRALTPAEAILQSNGAHARWQLP